MNAFLDAAIAEAEQGWPKAAFRSARCSCIAASIIGRGHNRRVQQGSAVLHGEMDALERAGRQPASVYRESVMLHDAVAVRDVQRRDPALRHPARRSSARTGRSWAKRSGCARAACGWTCVQDERCIAMMTTFIAAHPELWNEDIGDCESGDWVIW